MSFRYKEPTLSPDVAVATLVPESHDGQLLTPDTLVLAINRGAVALREKFDAEDYLIPPHTQGVVRLPYGAARHFQARAVVPGSRDVETARYESFIGILGVDDPEMCEPFTPEECAAIGQKVEAFAREPGEVQVIKTQQARARIPGQGASKSKRGIDASTQATPEAAANLESALTPVTPIYDQEQS